MEGPATIPDKIKVEFANFWHLTPPLASNVVFLPNNLPERLLAPFVTTLLVEGRGRAEGVGSIR